MSVGFYITFIGLLTRKYFEQTQPVQPGWLEGDSLERTRLPSYLLYLAKTGLPSFRAG